MSIIFISDLHLQKSFSDITEIFLKFTQSLPQNTEALYILGDLFEAWIGDDDTSPFHDNIIRAIRSISDRDIPIYILHGNRDFLLGKRFLKATGASLLPDETIIDLYGTKTLIMHGDALCIDDVAYQKFRKKVRKKWVRWLFLRKSLKKRRKIAEKLRSGSREYQQNIDESILDVNQAEVVRVMKKHNVTQLIHGHTHRPAIHEFDVDGSAYKRIVLAAWHTEGNELFADEHGSFSLINFS